MLGTYAAALMVIGASVPIGAAVLVLSGRREWSWIAPALGLAAITAIAWLTVRLPGEGLTALLALAVLTVGCGLVALPRIGFGASELREGLPAGALALALVSIPFAADGGFGILGTGFNVDMSQHLFVAEWIASPTGAEPSLIGQGYPAGPHSLAVAGAELSGNIVTAFSGVTIAVPVVGALTALAGTLHLGRVRAPLAAALVALPFLVASYLAQGAFKELFEATFLLAFALWLLELSGGAGGRDDAERSGARARLGFAVPGAVLALGALYAYSGPGLVWLAGAIAFWAVAELALDRARARRAARTALPALGVALAVLVVGAAPEATRIAEFGTSAGNVANAEDAEPSAAAAATAQSGAGDAGAGGTDRSVELFNDDLGNLFGDIPALEVLGVWPSGDFRVEPGGGGVPAPLFYLGALLGLAALAVGLRAAIRRRETALVAALGAALVIWALAALLSTPYAAAKALQMAAPLLTLVAVRGVLDPGFAPLREAGRAPRLAVGTALAAAFLAAAGASTALALANAPVGPERYTAGIAKLRERIGGDPVLLLAPPGQLADRRGGDYYAWELRGADPPCVVPLPEDREPIGGPAPEGIRYVLTIGGKRAAPFDDLEQVVRRMRVTLWAVPDYDRQAPEPRIADPARSTECDLGPRS